MLYSRINTYIVEKLHYLNKKWFKIPRRETKISSYETLMTAIVAEVTSSPGAATKTRDNKIKIWKFVALKARETLA